MHVDIFQALLPGDCKACALQYLPSVLVSRNIKPTWWRWWWFRTREKEPKCIINQSIYMQLVSSQKNKFQWEAVTFKFTWTQRFLEDDNVKGISLTFCVIWDNLRRRKTRWFNYSKLAMHFFKFKFLIKSSLDTMWCRGNVKEIDINCTKQESSLKQ